MRKVLLSMLAVMISVVFVAGVSLAAGNTVTGKVKAINAAKGQITICPSGTKKDVVYKIDTNMIKKKMLKVGNAVSAKLDPKDATKITTIRKMAIVPVGC